MPLVRFASAVALICALALSPSAQAGSAKSSAGELWTLIIPQAFPGHVYAWRLKPDGTYEEEGWLRETGTPVQSTLTGQWSKEGDKMTLRQDGLSYVFEGTVTGGRYEGTLTLGGREVSSFCARQGDTAPDRCEPTVAQAAAAKRES